MARLTFTSAYRRIYPESCDRSAQQLHAAQLTAGLARLPVNFMAGLCDGCKGTGSPTWQASPYEPCPICNASGLLQGDIEAPPSVLNQVLVAAYREA
ncbi:hypothetical protein J2X65_001688 [Ancylobacter sp. 3268]|nr:hypothetical protein [Ancylobacter sp. 3268]